MCCDPIYIPKKISNKQAQNTIRIYTMNGFGGFSIINPNEFIYTTSRSNDAKIGLFNGKDKWYSLTKKKDGTWIKWKVQTH